MARPRRATLDRDDGKPVDVQSRVERAVMDEFDKLLAMIEPFPPSRSAMVAHLIKQYVEANRGKLKAKGGGK